MSLDVTYCVVPWYQVWCLWVQYSFRNMTISSIFDTFDLHLWPSSSVKVTFIFIIWWTLCCCVLVPNKKLVGSTEFEIWANVWRKLKWRHNDVINHSNFMKFKHKSTKGTSKRHTEFQIDWTYESCREGNRELWGKNWFWATVTLTFDLRSPISIGFEPVS